MRALLLLILLAVPLWGCESDPTAPDEPVADVNQYMADLPEWSAFAPPADAFDGPTGDDPVVEIIDFNGDDYTCTSNPYRLTSTPQQIVTFDPDSEIFWLGALLQGKGHRDGIGSLAELPIRQRAPLTISINLLTQNNTRTVQNPDLATVSQAIGELIEAASVAGHTAGSDIYFDQRTTHSLQQSAIKLGMSARYMGSEVTTRLNTETSVEQHALTAYFTQNMFTTSMVLPQSPAELFSDQFTESKLQEQINMERIGPDNPPVYISSITWGRMLVLTMTSSRSISEMEAALDASFKAIGEGSIAQDHLDVLEESQIRLVTIGGDDDNARALLVSGQLGSYFAEESALVTARPLSYTIRTMDGDIASVAETTVYNIRECSQDLEVIGAVYRVDLERLYLVADGCDGLAGPSPEVYYTFYVGTTSELGSPVLQRSTGTAVTIAEGGSHDLGHAGKEVTILKDSGVSIRVLGDAWDYDSGSVDEHIGHWDLTWGYGVSNGSRYFTRHGNGCSIRLYVNIVKVRDVLGVAPPQGGGI